MKKYIIFIFILSISLGTGMYGQDKDSKQKAKSSSSSKKTYAPKKGDYTAAIIFGRGAYSNTGLAAPASFGATGTPVNGSAPFANDINSNDNSIINMVGAEGRYYVSDKIALTLSGGTILRNTPEHLSIPAVTTGGKTIIPGYKSVVADERIDINLTLGGQWTFNTGSKRMFPYLGIALPFNYARRSLYDPTVDSNNVITDLGARHVEITSFGIQAVAGVDYYLSEDVFIGFRIKPASFNYAFSDKIPGPGLPSLDSDTYTTSFFVQPSFSVGFNLGKKDSDGDGVYNKDDACPEVAGLAAFKGCPDTDGDGVQDSEDDCPNVVGVASLNGCPDADADGVADKDDACPYDKGSKATRGCPDYDKDGVLALNKDDKCPNVAGPAENGGCPWPDSDGDGVLDKDDKCIDEKGPASNGGCPDIKAATIKIDSYSKSILFNIGKSSFKLGVTEKLDDISNVIKKFSKFNFDIEGHTDNTGGDAINLRLSNERASSVKGYLVSKGIKTSRLTSKGYGSAKPVAPNTTNAGRTKNRRVEIKVSDDK